MEGVITNVVPIIIKKEGIFDGEVGRLWRWDHPMVELIAVMDGCSGVGQMKRWFLDHYDITESLEAQIIRWGEISP